MVFQGQLPNPRRGASAPRLPGTDSTPFCCVYSYAVNNEIVGAECVALTDDFTAEDCVALVPDPLDPAAPLRQFGVVAECCRDCELLARKLIIAKCGNRSYLVGGGGVLDSSPVESPEDCCCGDVPRCVQVPGCNQVDCYPEPPDSGDPCEGRCLTMEYDEDGVEIPEDRGLLCATKVQCCAEDNSSCTERCYDSTVVVLVPGEDPIAPEPLIVGPTNQWTAMVCTSDECGVCCTHVYDTDPESPSYRESIMRLGVTSLTKEECQAIEYDPNFLGPIFEPVPLGPRGDWVAHTDDTNVCNPPCCLDQQFGDAREANCHYTDQLFCDPCVGRCIDVAAESDPGMCPRQRCATKQDCCGEDGQQCEDGGLCGEDNPALYRWEPMGCVENAEDVCGVCCKINYAVNGQIDGYTCDTNTTTREQCERTIILELPPPLDPDAVPPTPGEVPYGTWAPFETCRACPGSTVPCCVELDCPIPELDPGDGNNNIQAQDYLKAYCGEVSPEECDPCKGRCTDLVTLAQRCKTKTECCGDDGVKCGADPGVDDVGCGQDPVPAVAAWSATEGCADPTACGICCVNVYDNSGEVITKYCENSLSYEDCTQMIEFLDADIEDKPYGTWVPYETCESYDCEAIPRKTCCMPACDPESQDVECRSVIETIECNQCAGRCAELDADGLETGVATCQEKWDCCGQFNELCDPDCGVPARFSWTPCGDAACGICCLPEDVVPPDPMSAAACEEVGGTWHPYAKDDSVCGPHNCCHEITTVAGRTKTICAPSHEECTPCEGVCVELDLSGGNCPNETCLKKADCCDPCEKCTPVVDGGLGTHEWAEACDYSCPGCCCINRDPASPNVTFTDAYTCEACCGYAICSFTTEVASCADCPPDGDCYDYGPGEIFCSYSVTVASCPDCDCNSASCGFIPTFGDCGKWQPDCAISQVRGNCSGCYRVRITGTRPECTVPGECLAEGGPINVDTVICWTAFGSGVGYRFTNGGNNGYVGIYPTCDGWAAYFYDGSGFFWASREPDPDAPYPWQCDKATIESAIDTVYTRSTVYKQIDPSGCDPSYSGELTLNFIDRTLNPFRVFDQFFTVNFEVSRVENITEDNIHDVLQINPFP